MGRSILAATAIGAGAIIFASANSFKPVITYNVSASAPLGWYKIDSAASINRGDYVLTYLPASARKLASERGYLPSNIPLLKQIFATEGDPVCINHREVLFGTEPVATALTIDRMGRRMPQLKFCRELEKGEYFLLNLAHKGSYDSRYYGPVTDALVIGKAIPLWTWDDKQGE